MSLSENPVLRSLAVAVPLALGACNFPAPTPAPVKPTVEDIIRDVCAHGVHGVIKKVKGAPKNDGFVQTLQMANPDGWLAGGFYNPYYHCDPAKGVVPHTMAGHLDQEKSYLTTGQYQDFPKAYTFQPNNPAEVKEDARQLAIPASLKVNAYFSSVFLGIGPKPYKSDGVDAVDIRTYGSPYDFTEVIIESFPREGLPCVSVGFLKTLEGLRDKPYAPYLFVEDQGTYALDGTPTLMTDFLDGMKGAKDCDMTKPKK